MLQCMCLFDTPKYIAYCKISFDGKITFEQGFVTAYSQWQIFMFCNDKLIEC